MNAPFLWLFPPVAQFASLLDGETVSHSTVAQWLSTVPIERQQPFDRGLRWLLKMEILEKVASD
jgi:hypothetical protein